MSPVAATAGILLLLLGLLMFLLGLVAVALSAAFPIYLTVGAIPTLAAAAVFARPKSRRAMLIGGATGWVLAALAFVTYLRPASVVPSTAVLGYAVLAATAGALLTIEAVRLRGS